MKRMHPYSLCLIGLILFALVGCDSGSAEETETPPDLLSPEVFTLQADLFQNSSSKTAGTRAHFTAAALRVWPVSVLISANLIIPVAVTVAALQDEQPSFEDGAWVWSSTAQANGQTISFTLIGRLDQNGASWSMRITASQPILGQVYDDFELYTAEAALNGQVGSWRLFYRINGVSQNVLNAGFVITDDDTKSIIYSIPASAQQNAGDSVRYETEEDTRRFFWQQVNAGLEHDIEWDALTQAGSITATNYINAEQGCWDENLDDIDC